MQRINVNLYPSAGGYTFLESDGTRIVGQSWRGVVQKVRDYRARNGLPTGDAEAEVEQQACARNPNLCAATQRIGREPVREQSLKARVIRWMAELDRDLGGDGVKARVPDAEAKRRATICATCPANAQLPPGCAACREAVAGYRKNILGRNAPVLDARAEACGILGIHTPTAACLDEAAVENAALPAHCWRKKTL